MTHAPDLKKSMPLILASASPRRKEILEAHGLSPIILPSNAEEILPDGAAFSPEEGAMYLAELKAFATFSTLSAGDWPHGCKILGVDTIVYKDRVIGKPTDEADALLILRTLKNTVHEVISGVCILWAEVMRGELHLLRKSVFFDCTRVHFGDYTDAEILTYVRANPPYDKSGSYAIQSDWGRHVKLVEGDIENVIGLPYKKLAPFL